jgi:uncharacterized protein YqfA (UPF0365 family)
MSDLNHAENKNIEKNKKLMIVLVAVGIVLLGIYFVSLPFILLLLLVTSGVIIAIKGLDYFNSLLKTIFNDIKNVVEPLFKSSEKSDSQK